MVGIVAVEEGQGFGRPPLHGPCDLGHDLGVDRHDLGERAGGIELDGELPGLGEASNPPEGPDPGAHEGRPPADAGLAQHLDPSQVRRPVPPVGEGAAGELGRTGGLVQPAEREEQLDGFLELGRLEEQGDMTQLQLEHPGGILELELLPEEVPQARVVDDGPFVGRRGRQVPRPQVPPDLPAPGTAQRRRPSLRDGIEDRGVEEEAPFLRAQHADHLAREVGGEVPDVVVTAGSVRSPEGHRRHPPSGRLPPLPQVGRTVTPGGDEGTGLLQRRARGRIP